MNDLKKAAKAMRRKYLIAGILTLLTLSSCGVKNSTPQAQDSSQQQTVVSREPSAPAEQAGAEFEGDDEDSQAYDVGGQADQQNVANSNSPQRGSQPVDPSQVSELIRMNLQLCQQRMEMTQMTYDMARQTGNTATMQAQESQMQMHRQMFSELENASQNPQAYTSEQSLGTLVSRIQEYDYRSQTGDQRPTAQIQPELAQFRAQAAYNATSEGQAAFQNGLNNEAAQQRVYTDNMTAGHNARMRDIEANGQAHQQRMRNLEGQHDAHNRGWARDQNVGDERQAQNVHGIYNEYEYADPNTGQRYWVPGEAENPAVINPDGTQTDLEPYYPSSNY